MTEPDARTHPRDRIRAAFADVGVTGWLHAVDIDQASIEAGRLGFSEFIVTIREDAGHGGPQAAGPPGVTPPAGLGFPGW